MKALLELTDGRVEVLERASLNASEGTHDEKWLQDLLFRSPELIPISDTHPGSSTFLPICRELGIPKNNGNTVFLDLFGITPEGRLVLVECKLWRNPQARREVIAQALEYAAMLTKWSYSDLTARLLKRSEFEGDNPLYQSYAEQGGRLDEATLHDRVSKGLKTGDFAILLAGDGIREDALAIAELLTSNAGLAASLAAVEYHLFGSEGEPTVVVPSVPFRTEVIRHRVFFSGEDQLLEIEGEASSLAGFGAEKPEDIWADFIAQADFDHAEQSPPKRGGQGWVRMKLPDPLGHLTAYRSRSDDRGGMFIRLSGEQGLDFYNEVLVSKEGLEAELGFELEVKDDPKNSGAKLVSTTFDKSPFDDEVAFLAWLLPRSNALVSVFRTYLSQIYVG